MFCGYSISQPVDLDYRKLSLNEDRKSIIEAIQLDSWVRIVTQICKEDFALFVYLLIKKLLDWLRLGPWNNRVHHYLRQIISISVILHNVLTLLTCVLKSWLHILCFFFIFFFFQRGLK